jgi:signal transduction histidine kinase/PAS domain-containing protein
VDHFRKLAAISQRFAYILTLSLFVLVVVFYLWLIYTFFASVQFRDRLINLSYEGSLSPHLGFLLALTSEASRNEDLNPVEKSDIELTEQLRSIQRRLANLRLLNSSASSHIEPIYLEQITDPTELLLLLGDPRLDQLSLHQLGLRVNSALSLPDYPFLESSIPDNGVSSFVFIPSSRTEAGGPAPDLSLKLRRDLVFSKLAEQELRHLMAKVPKRRVAQAYYVSCSDFVRFVFLQPRLDVSPYQGFWPLRSFVDRTYFRAAQSSSYGLRVSAPYLDVTGAGFVQTYSAFVQNSNLGLCGMLALDVDQQSLENFWQEVTLRKRRFRDFTFGTYLTNDRSIEPADLVPKRLREDLISGLERADLLGGIQRLTVGDDTKVFTVPMGGGKVGLFVFDAGARRRKYWSIVIGGIAAMICFVAMVSITTREQQSVAEAERRHFEILENLHGGFVIVDRNGKIMDANGRFWEMVGSRRTHDTIYRYLSPESEAEFRKSSLSNKGFEFAGTLVSVERRSAPVIIASAPLLFSGRGQSRMLILIPSRELEQAIAKKFLNVFSHALKSPVHSILQIADLFRRRNAMSRFDEYYSLLQRRVQEFRFLTDNVLRFSALDVKDIQVEWESVNVPRVLRGVLRAVRGRFQAKGLALHENIPENLRVRADEKLLQVVFDNLIDNALKYTAAGYIAVLAKDLITEVQVVVEDSGPGVPEAERERIFELFTQGSGAHGSGVRPATHEGLGLGLFVSRRYVETMGGILSYEPVFEGVVVAGADEALAGSRFIVKLPKNSEGQVRGEENGSQERDTAA